MIAAASLPQVLNPEAFAMKLTTLASVVLLAATAPALAQPAKSMDSDKGAVLVGANDMTLYTYAEDSEGMSACYDTCAKNWPPYMADSTAKADGAYTLVERTDGTMQWAKDGKPLYYFIKDKKMGDVTGDGLMNGEWQVARP